MGTLDPLIGMSDWDKPLRSKVLAVPKYRQQYLSNIRELAEKSLDWETLGPFIESQAEVIGEAVKAETRSMTSYDAFVAATSEESQANADGPGRRGISLKQFADGRRKFLLEYKPAETPNN